MNKVSPGADVLGQQLLGWMGTNEAQEIVDYLRDQGNERVVLGYGGDGEKTGWFYGLTAYGFARWEDPEVIPVDPVRKMLSRKAEVYVLSPLDFAEWWTADGEPGAENPYTGLLFKIRMAVKQMRADANEGFNPVPISVAMIVFVAVVTVLRHFVPLHLPHF